MFLNNYYIILSSTLMALTEQPILRRFKALLGINEISELDTCMLRKSVLLNFCAWTIPWIYLCAKVCRYYNRVNKQPIQSMQISIYSQLANSLLLYYMMNCSIRVYRSFCCTYEYHAHYAGITINALAFIK